MCKHIATPYLSVGIIYFILETTLFRCSASPPVKPRSDVPESAFPLFASSIDIYQLCILELKSGTQYANHGILLCLFLTRRVMANTQNSTLKRKLSFSSFSVGVKSLRVIGCKASIKARSVRIQDEDLFTKQGC